MKLRLRTPDGATFDAEGSDAFVNRTSEMFQRTVLEMQLKDCRERIAALKKWERGLVRALKALELSPADDAVARPVTSQHEPTTRDETPKAT